MINTSRMPGFGDPETWPPCTGHPLDPRTDDTIDHCPECGSTDLQEIDMGYQCAECGEVFDV